MTNKVLIEDIIKTIKEEIEVSSEIEYRCKDGTNIGTDVGYVYEWFCSKPEYGRVGYEDILRRKYIE